MKTASLRITPEVLKLIAELEDFKGSWRNLTTVAPERLITLKHTATIESIGSSTRIEGVQLTDEEIEKLLGRVKATVFVSRDEQEVGGYAEVMEAIFDSHQEIPISENYIKQLHTILLRHSTKDDRHRGEYKKVSNSIEAFDAEGKSIGTIFETATPFDTPMRMQELVSWTRETLSDNAWHPLIVIGVFVVVFLEIHPFQDGNGRLSRALTTLLLLKTGYSYVAYSSLECVIERNKEDYYLALRRTQVTLKEENPNYDPWLRFFLRSLKQQKDRLANHIEAGLSLDELHPDSLKIIEYLKSARRITTREAQRLTGVPRPTVKSRLSGLVKSGLIARHGKGRGAWYGFLNPK
jgi:Fic family protein